MVIETNEILFRIQKALNLTTDEMMKAYDFQDYEMESSHLASLLVRRQDKDFKICSYEELGLFLDGLIVLKRGLTTNKSEEDGVELTNNLILKKLRIALELKEVELLNIFAQMDIFLTKQQLSSMFRNPQHKNYKPCSDELLVSFLDGLYLSKKCFYF